MVEMPDTDGKPSLNYRGFAEGSNLLDSGHVGVALYQQKNGVKCIKANIRSSQTVSRTYQTQINFGQPFSASCTCKAGLSERCSHICALLMKVVEATSKGLTGQSSTDKACAWNAATAKNVTPATMEVVYCHKKTQSKTQQFLSEKEMLLHFEKCPLDVSKLQNTMLHTVLKPRRKLPAGGDEDGRAFLQQEHGQHDCKRLCQLCQDFFVTNVLLSPEQAATLANHPQGSAAWHKERFLRITASEARSIPIKAAPEKWVSKHIHPSFYGNASTRYGRESEAKARAWYKKTKTTDVVECGLIIRPATSWLGASPDGIIPDSDTVLEIKCPTPLTVQKHGSLDALFKSGKYDVIKKENKLTLSKAGKNRYYLQVQLQLFCCERSRCDFVIWAPNEAYIIEVPYDKEFISKQVAHLEDFYFSHLLPAVVDSKQ
ncbi:uncharacterized protein LOC144133956 [Amblyomma americanum]